MNKEIISLFPYPNSSFLLSHVRGLFPSISSNSTELLPSYHPICHVLLLASFQALLLLLPVLWLLVLLVSIWLPQLLIAPELPTPIGAADFLGMKPSSELAFGLSPQFW
jgi:hypothetical protein